jgi:signal transduction histidine kinase
MSDTQPGGEFLEALAHELRSPVAAIGYLAGLLAGECIGPRERELAVAHIAKSAAALEGTCDAVAELGRLDRAGGARPGAAVDIAGAAQRAIEETDLGGRTCTLEPPLLIAAVDGDLIRRVLALLLGEATARTPDGTTIAVSLHRDRRGVLIAVEDRSPWRGPPPRPRLGMMLARRFAEAHGGHLGSTERPGGGTSVRVFLAEPQPGEPRDLCAAESPGVLTVDRTATPRAAG